MPPAGGTLQVVRMVRMVRMRGFTDISTASYLTEATACLRDYQQRVHRGLAVWDQRDDLMTQLFALLIQA